jgi:GTP diphosphokinase / guanosine-3',5'-bis(diphosphate) 3'-diphosphatase
MNKRNKSSNILLPVGEIFEALRFSADKHKLQKRKGASGIPYINHPIEVTSLLIRTMDAPSKELIMSALLHDTLEDTNTKPSEIKELFGDRIMNIVTEVTDDMSLSAEVRKHLQIVKAPSLSTEARCIKIADKTCNINDILFTRIKWPRRKKIAYVRWAVSVIAGIRDTNEGLINNFDDVVLKAEELLDVRFL